MDICVGHFKTDKYVKVSIIKECFSKQFISMIEMHEKIESLN